MKEFVDNELLGCEYGQVYFLRGWLMFFNFCYGISRTSVGMLLCRLESKDWKEELVLSRVEDQYTGLGRIMQWVLLEFDGKKFQTTS